MIELGKKSIIIPVCLLSDPYPTCPSDTVCQAASSANSISRGPPASGLRLRPCEALQGSESVRAVLRNQAISSPLSLPQTVPQKRPCLLCEEPQTPLSCSGRCSCTATSFPSHLLMLLIAPSLFPACMPFISYQDFAASYHI